MAFDYELEPDHRFIKYSDIKVGDKLLVKSLKWYEDNKDEDEEVYIGSTFIPGMERFCNKYITVTKICECNNFEPPDIGIYNYGCQDAKIEIKEDNGWFIWSLGMFQGKANNKMEIE